MQGNKSLIRLTFKDLGWFSVKARKNPVLGMWNVQNTSDSTDTLSLLVLS